MQRARKIGRQEGRQAGRQAGGLDFQKSPSSFLGAVYNSKYLQKCSFSGLSGVRPFGRLFRARGTGNLSFGSWIKNPGCFQSSESWKSKRGELDSELGMFEELGELEI